MLPEIDEFSLADALRDSHLDLFGEGPHSRFRLHKIAILQL
jgi:hypothetical protein